MPGASPHSQWVKILNANRRADGGDGSFELLVITEDDQRHTMPASPAAMTALSALASADTTLVWDPTNRTLIAANTIGGRRTRIASPQALAGERDAAPIRRSPDQDPVSTVAWALADSV